MINAKSAILVIVASLAVGGCQTGHNMDTHISRMGEETPYHQHPSQTWWHYKFAYYPKQQVYYEPYTEMYYWFAHGQWEQGTDLPGNLSLFARDARTVRLRFERPYVQHLSVLRSQWPYDTPLPGSTEKYNFTPEGIAMTEQRYLERSGVAPVTEPAFGEGFFATVEPAAEQDMDVDAEFGFQLIEADEPLFTTADPVLETGGLEP